jgi:hypothetical protein
MIVAGWALAFRKLTDAYASEQARRLALKWPAE